ncbi:MAG: hypothetical protein HYV36_06755 [Lentisphaerae bacterium]|nr:hypothetical protein [Lentisphaerota bacterium]
MEISAPLTLLGVIATILGLGFALAAFLNSRHRQRHMPDDLAGLNPQQKPPLPRIKQATEAALRQEQADEQPQVERGTTLFKQVDHLGKPTDIRLLNGDDNNDYVWE